MPPLQDSPSFSRSLALSRSRSAAAMFAFKPHSSTVSLRSCGAGSPSALPSSRDTKSLNTSSSKPQMTVCHTRLMPNNHGAAISSLLRLHPSRDHDASTRIASPPSSSACVSSLFNGPRQAGKRRRAVCVGEPSQEAEGRSPACQARDLSTADP